MTDQMSLSGFESPDYQEEQFLESIFPKLMEAVESKGGEPNLLTKKPTQTDSKSSGYTVVYFHNFTAFRLRMRGKQFYISLPVSFSDLIPEGFPIKRMESDPKYIRILVNQEYPIERYSDFLALVAGETVNRYPKEYDCCSRYLECSDAKTCIHPDRIMALGCGYRKILHSGRIFYGKNRNVD